MTGQVKRAVWGVLFGAAVALAILLLRQALGDAQSIQSGIIFAAGMALVGGVCAGLAGRRRSDR